MDNKKTGSHGESIAAELLHKNGYSIVERNVRIGRGELDIVACRDGVYHFVEVKTRTGIVYGSAVESLTRSKVSRLSKLAQAYMKGIGSPNCQFSVDLIAIDIDGDGLIESNWIKNITL